MLTLFRWRPREHNTDNQPWDPISAVTASLVADISNIAMAVADFPRGMFQGKKDKKQKDKDSKESESRTGSSGDVFSNLPSNESRATIQTSGSGSAEVTSVAELPTGKDAQPQPVDSAVPGAVELPKEAEARGLAPSVTVTSDESVGPNRTASFETGAIQLREQSPGPSSPRPSHSRSHSSSHSRTHSRSHSRSHSRTPSQNEPPYQNIDLEEIRGAGTSVREIVTTGIKSPMNLCLGLAKGFRNAPRLYNDETVRPPEKVHDLTSGLRVAGREFGFGMYDGLSGLVTQPLKGAQKGGGVGLVKGFGRGIGGAFMKPFSGKCLCDVLLFLFRSPAIWSSTRVIRPLRD